MVPLDEFQAHLERLRIDGHVHSISVVIAKDQAIAWSRAMGEEDTRAIADTTVYPRDREAYIRGKTDLVRSILARARNGGATSFGDYI